MVKKFRCTCGNISSSETCDKCGKSLNFSLILPEIVTYYARFAGTISTLSTCIVRRAMYAALEELNYSSDLLPRRYINGGNAYAYPCWLFTFGLEKYLKKKRTYIPVSPRFR